MIEPTAVVARIMNPSLSNTLGRCVVLRPDGWMAMDGPGRRVARKKRV
jgi:hypothetical protein